MNQDIVINTSHSVLKSNALIAKAKIKKPMKVQDYIDVRREIKRQESEPIVMPYPRLVF